MKWIRPHRWPSRASLSNQEGFSLVELLVALGVILIALIAMVYTITVSMSNVAYARQRTARTHWPIGPWSRSERCPSLRSRRG